jgi:hypothetical protein
VDASAWTVEHSPGSRAELRRIGADPAPGGPPARRIGLGFELAGGERAGQYAALVTSDIGTLGWARWLRLDLAAGAPLRVSLQLREPAAGGGGRRWRRSIALEPARQTYVVPLDSFVPVADAAGPVPVDRVRALLIVVDTVNTPPGRGGEIVVHGLRAEAP